jgi:hypothetical protein
MGDKTSKKVHTRRASEDTPNPHYYEQQYTPSAMIGKMLGLHPKAPEINREAKTEKPKGVGMSDIREKYRKDKGK